MFGIVGYTGFVLSSVLLNMTPGADTIYILSKSATGGRVKGVVSALGISTGILIHTLFAAFGLSIVLAKSAVLFNAMKLVGAGYLIVMGIMTIISKKSLVGNSDIEKSDSLFKIYRQGVLTNALNPKVSLFFLALLPQYVAADNIYGPLPLLLLGLTFFFTSTVWCIFVAFLSSFISKLLKKNEKVGIIASKLTGVIYIALGLNVLRAKLDA